MPDFFIISDANKQSELATWSSSVGVEAIRCALNPDHQRAGRRIGDLSVDMPAKSARLDFVWSWASDCLIQEMAAQAMVRSEVTGFETRPARVSIGLRHYDDLFRELVATGWGGVANPASGVHLTHSCPSCGLLKYSGVEDWTKLFDSGKWDGSDVFMVWPLPRFIFGTEKVASLIEKAGFTGVRAIPLAEMKRFPGDLGPGRLSYWLDESRLKELKIDPAIR